LPMKKDNTQGNWRVVQMIDTLHLGGAEVMAVNLSNVFADHHIPVMLLVTRTAGKAQNRLKEGVPVVLGNKKNAFDIWAFWRIWRALVRFKPTHLHAHSSSIIWAAMIKILMPGIKLIWHDHNGMRDAIINKRDVSKNDAKQFSALDKSIRRIKGLFFRVIVLNELSKQFANKELGIPVNQIITINNFAYLAQKKNYCFEYAAKKNILIVANLREQKAHDFLFRSIDDVLVNTSDWQFLIVGKDYNNAWSEKLRLLHNKLMHKNKVLMLGEREDVFDIMCHCDIGILTSKSEALPVTLIEYGLAGLPVLASDVGHCKSVLASEDAVFPYGNQMAFVHKLKRLIKDEDWRKHEAVRLHAHIKAQYGKERVFKQLLLAYGNIESKKIEALA
jgi:glycosyltransferase involved in cell wall biosynthesis